ncbi:MAG: hypothetical protein HXM16_01090 [Fusobacterium periodonticum]|nr:hypothetical protein [Fusobacterium periodonticum]
MKEDPTQILAYYTTSEEKARKYILNYILNKLLHKLADISEFINMDWGTVIEVVKNKYNVSLSYMLHLENDK